jgi:Spy/CpxP family protein refolding chaperone
MKMTSKLLLSALTLTTTAVVALAQDTPREGGRRGGDRGGFNIEEFRNRMNARIKEQLKATDEEWAVLQPLIEKVQTKQREAMTSRGFGGFFGGRGGGGDRGADRGGGGGGGGGDRGDRAGSPQAQALRTAIESDSTSAEDLKAKLAAVREARKKAAAELEAARADLAKVLSVRQEAVLVSMGVLE